jgi:hypothetical protein
MEESSTEKKKLIAELTGVIDYEHYLDFKRKAITGMYNFGDEFIKCLSWALSAANDDDSVKIIRIWSNQIAQCEMMQRIAEAKAKAERDIMGIPNCT